MSNTRPKGGRSVCWFRGILVLVGCAMVSGCDTGSRAPLSPARVAEAASASLRVQVNEGDGTSVDLLGLSADERTALSQVDDARRKEALRVYVAGSSDEDLPSIAGDVQQFGEVVRFTPRYPFRPGLRYRAVWNRRALQVPGGTATDPAEESWEFEIPRPASPPTTVTHIYPTAERLPENQLKFYLHFSGPMRRGDAYEHIHLLDGAGNELPAVFLELGEELWDPAMRRFTLLLDPGRVKRGLVPRTELGPVLESDRDYTLVVDRDWTDANGRPLAAGVQKRFSTAAADEQPIDLAAWKITAPAAGTRTPLVVHFPEALDHSLLLRMLRVAKDRATPVSGSVETLAAETAWQFTPDNAWVAGEYQLLIDAALEDLAGNAVGRAFDVDTFNTVGERIEAETVSLPFHIVAP